MARELYFIRHAVPIDEPGTFQPGGPGRVGADDPPLSPRGREQARRLAPHVNRLGVTRLVSSGLLRARETAAVIGEATTIPHTDVLSDLDEIEPGALTSATLFELARLDPAARVPGLVRPRAGAAWYRTLSTIYFVQWLRRRTHGGDDPVAVVARIERSLARLAAMPEPRIAVVGHGYWIFYMVLRCLPRGRRHLSQVRPWVDNCSVTTLARSGVGRFRLTSFARRLD